MPWSFSSSGCTPGLFLHRSEVLPPHTQNLSSSPSAGWCKLGLSKAPTAFANGRFFESLTLNISVSPYELLHQMQLQNRTGTLVDYGSAYGSDLSWFFLLSCFLLISKVFNESWTTSQFPLVMLHRAVRDSSSLLL